MNGVKKSQTLESQSEPVNRSLTDLTIEQLMDFYWELPRRVRDTHFVGTSKAAEMAGVTQRTIELWIECGLIRAVSIGKKYKVSLSSLKEYLNNQAASRLRL